MFDDYMYDEDAAYERYLVERDEARYYDMLGFPAHQDEQVVEYDPDEMYRGGDDAYTTARRSGEPTYREVT